MERTVRRFVIKVNDDSLYYANVKEMKKEWFRTCFGGATNRTCQYAWGKERMTPRFLTWTISWRVVPFSERWKLGRTRNVVGEGNLSIVSLSLDCFSLYLHLVNLLPIFGSQLKCHSFFSFFKCHFLKKVLSSTTQLKPNFYIKYMLSWYHVFFFSTCAMLQKWTLTCCLCCFCEWGHPTSSSHQADPPADQKGMKEPSWEDPK